VNFLKRDVRRYSTVIALLGFVAVSVLILAPSPTRVFAFDPSFDSQPDETMEAVALAGQCKEKWFQAGCFCDTFDNCIQGPVLFGKECKDLPHTPGTTPFACKKDGNNNCICTI
jgi:hypothetical protein